MSTGLPEDWGLEPPNRVRVAHGDSREVLKQIPDASVDSVVTDPPYALVSIVKRFANSPRSERTENTENPYGRTGRGFMGQRWDTGETAFATEFWTEVLRVLKPGGHVLAFGGTRTYHRLAVAIEDAGFEIRDQIGWLYGSGFPKSHNQHGEWQGWGTALKPAWEPIVLARKPLIATVAENVLQNGTGALNIDGCRVAAGRGDEPLKWESPRGGIWRTDTQAQAQAQAQDKGRWPANVIHDGSEEVIAAFPNTESGTGAVKRSTGSGYQANAYGKESRPVGTPNVEYGDSGSAARFFYSAKADANDRLGSKHPTVKPVDLMRYLCRLVTRPGGLVLDPFAGSGSTGVACIAEGFRAILIEREEEYVADIRRRIAWAQGEGGLTEGEKLARVPDEKKRGDDLPLFGGEAA